MSNLHIMLGMIFYISYIFLEGMWAVMETSMDRHGLYCGEMSDRLECCLTDELS
jgi:hypothetical protein